MLAKKLQVALIGHFSGNAGGDMFSIKYEDWKDVCDMYFKQKKGRLEAYLQWFPFSKLGKNDKAIIKSKEFFTRYVQNGAGVLFPQFLTRTDNYMQKGDGSFRSSSLLSPFLYLVVQSIGKTISQKYQIQRPKEISIYYAGNYEENRCFYRHDYDSFYKEINSEIENYNYFIKTDIRDFFNNINLNKLFYQIDKIANADDLSITQHHLELYKNLLAYCGNGKFPLVENSVASSYLSTMIYLDDIDNRLFHFISTKLSDITSFKMIRYVDDLYILIQADSSLNDLKENYNEIIQEYSSILKEYDLSLNTSKVGLKKIGEINDELKKSLYDDHVNGIKYEIAELKPDSATSFLEKIEAEAQSDYLTTESYIKIVKESFTIDGTVFTPDEVFNYFIYENTEVIRSKEALDIILRILGGNISFISLDPKRLTTMIMKAKNNAAIKAFLNNLFIRNRAGKWNSYDTTITINYLIQSRFRHIDLISILKTECPTLHNYYKFFCKQSFLTSMNDQKNNVLCDIIQSDTKTYYLHIMYLFEKSKDNSMTSFAFFKNYFDRITAHIAFAVKYDNNRKPNYKLFYRESEHKKFYNCIPDAGDIIEKAHRLRNDNPLSHSSAGLIDINSSTEDLRQSISELNQLVQDFCEAKDFFCTTKETYVSEIYEVVT
jgi:AbiA family abortive infection protein